MTRGFAATFALATLIAACKPTPPGQKTGPAVAQGDGVTVTADEFKARLDEQSPFIRQRYQTLERKKEFLDNLIRFEVLAHAAEKEGLQNDPDVQLTLRKVMVQKLVQKRFSEGDAAKEVPDADVQKFYDEHKDEFQKPARLRLAGTLVAANDKDRAAKSQAAKKTLAQVKAAEKKDPMALQNVARTSSDDAATKPTGGDLGFKSKDELAKQYGPAFAAAAFQLKDGEIVVLDTPQGFWIVRVTGRQDEVNRPVDQVKPQIQQRLFREKRTKEFDEYVKRLRDDAHVTVNDAELEKIPVAQASPGGHNMMPGMPGGMGPHGGAAPMPPPPAATPAPAPPASAPAPAPK